MPPGTGAFPGAVAADDDVEALKASRARLAHKYLTEAVPAIEPVAVEVPVSGTTAGIAVRGIADIVTMDGTVIDVKTASRKPSGLAADHALQLAIYAQLVPGASGETRIDTLVSAKDTQLIQIDHTHLEAMANAWLNGSIRWSPKASLAACICRTAARACAAGVIAFADACEREFGGTVAA
jgi:hypothetical protein